MINTQLRRRSLMGQGGGDAPVFVDWIQNTGPEIINLDIQVDTYKSLVFDVELTTVATKGGCKFFGYRTANGVDDFSVGVWDNRIDPRCPTILAPRSYPVYKNEKIGLASGWNYNSSRKIAYQYIPRTDEYFINDAGSGPYTLPYRDVGLFGYYEGDVPNPMSSSFRMKVYSGYFATTNVSPKIIHNDWRPCYYRGEYGLWDTVNNKFYGNVSGAGAFIGGYDD